MPVVKVFKHGSAPCRSGLRLNHLGELLEVPQSSSENCLRSALTKIFNMPANGRVTSDLVAWIAGAPLTVLAKPDIGVHTIAVGETLRRLVIFYASCLRKSYWLLPNNSIFYSYNSMR